MFKFSVDKSKLGQLESTIQAGFQKVIEDNSVMTEIGKTVCDRVRFQARAAKPFNQSSSFPALEPSTVRNRAYLAKYNPVHPAANPSLANVTLTGEFLDSLSAEIVSPGNLDIAFRGMHRRYRGKNGQPIGRETSNAEISGYLEKLGFVVFDSTIQQYKTITTRVTAIVKAALRRSLRLR